MNNHKVFQIEIPKPCDQSWDDMTPQGHGRHCDSCSKIVIDFSTWSDTELFAFFAKNNGSFCGRYLDAQLHRPIHKPYTTPSSWYRMAIAMGFTLLFDQMHEAKAQSRPLVYVAEAPISEQKMAIGDTSMKEIRGVVTGFKKEPLMNASVQILQNSEVKGAAITDFDGNYSIKVLDSGSYNLKVSCLGYSDSTEFIVIDKGKQVTRNVELRFIGQKQNVLKNYRMGLYIKKR